MPDADMSTWTCPNEIADEVLSWVDGRETPPPSGSYVDIATEKGKTSFTLM
jgi:hypothetical protein